MNFKNTAKKSVAALVKSAGVSRLARWSLGAMTSGPYIRAVNYHGTPESSAAQFERHLQFYQRHFHPVNEADLRDLLKGAWTKPKPGLIISFDDGLESNYRVAAPLVEEYGFTGWFFIPTELLGQEPTESDLVARGHDIVIAQGDPGSLMGWGQVRELAQHHAVGSHTATHCRLESDVPADRLREEIVRSKERLERELGRECSSFCWVGGEEFSYSREGAEVIASAGYEFGFMTNLAPIRPGANALQLQRTNIEANWTLDMVEFYLSGLMDATYSGKRRRVIEITSVSKG
jgi:peptidoglycan/xylan/chitin deacetylase (PgdA/CDA1 family)